MSIVFIGSQPIGYKCLNAVLKLNIKVSAVFTFEPEKHEIWSRSVDLLAKENDIPLYFHEDLTIEKIKELKPELVLVVGYRKLFPKDILNIPKYGVIGLHASLLPHLRGQAPLNWAIINGDKKAGVTMFKMDEGIDTGDIVAQKEISIGIKTTISELKEKISELGEDLIIENISRLLDGNGTFTSQSYNGTYGSARIPSDGKIDWRWKTMKIYNFIRGLEPNYPAFTELDTQKISILNAELVDERRTYFGTPGQIGMTFKDGSVLVITGDGALKINKVSLENGVEVDAKTILKSTKIRLQNY